MAFQLALALPCPQFSGSLEDGSPRVELLSLALEGTEQTLKTTVFVYFNLPGGYKKD